MGLKFKWFRAQFKTQSKSGYSEHETLVGRYNFKPEILTNDTFSVTNITQHTTKPGTSTSIGAEINKNVKVNTRTTLASKSETSSKCSNPSAEVRNLQNKEEAIISQTQTNHKKVENIPIESISSVNVVSSATTTTTTTTLSTSCNTQKRRNVEVLSHKENIQEYRENNTIENNATTLRQDGQSQYNTEKNKKHLKNVKAVLLNSQENIRHEESMNKPHTSESSHNELHIEEINQETESKNTDNSDTEMNQEIQFIIPARELDPLYDIPTEVSGLEYEEIDI